MEEEADTFCYYVSFFVYHINKKALNVKKKTFPRCPMEGKRFGWASPWTGNQKQTMSIQQQATGGFKVTAFIPFLIYRWLATGRGAVFCSFLRPASDRPSWSISSFKADGVPYPPR